MDKAPYDTLLQALAVILPIAAAALALMLLLRSRRRSRPGSSPLPEMSSSGPIQAVLELRPDGGQVAELAPAQNQLYSVDAILAKIDQASANGEKTSLSGLYIQLAGAHERLGDTGAQMSALRSAAGCGALHGPPEAHAMARLALAEVAHRAGDLTSACEQWQMARTAFLDAGDTERQAQVAKRMDENGCPTDWVLTDF